MNNKYNLFECQHFSLSFTCFSWKRKGKRNCCQHGCMCLFLVCRYPTRRYTRERMHAQHHGVCRPFVIGCGRGPFLSSFTSIGRCLRCWNRSSRFSVRDHAERRWGQVERQPVNSKMDDDLFQLRQLPWVEPIACVLRGACDRLRAAPCPTVRGSTSAACTASESFAFFVFVLHSRGRAVSPAARRSLRAITWVCMGCLAYQIITVILWREKSGGLNQPSICFVYSRCIDLRCRVKSILHTRRQT